MNEEGRVLLGAVFDEFVKNGAQMFIGMRMAPTEDEHAQAYYDFMQPKDGQVIVDLGCGVGGCGYYLNKINPSLRIVNVVNELPLIEHMKANGRECVYASYEDTGIPDKFADGVMFNESIGYSDLNKTLGEASRILKDGGFLTIKDFSPLKQDKGMVAFDEWDYHCVRPDIFIGVAYKYGFSLVKMEHPEIHMGHWDELMGDNNDVKRVLGEDPKLLPICQTLYKFVKGDLNGRA